MKIKFILSILLMISQAYAQHIGVSVSNKGIQNILTSTINSYGGNQKHLNNIVIPGDTVFDRIDKKFFDTNPIVNRIQQFISFEQKEDLVFYFDWSPITVKSNLIPQTLKVNVTGEKRQFKAAIKFSLDRLTISGRHLELCELKKWKCHKDDSLYGRFNNYVIRLDRGDRIDIAAIVDVKVLKGNVEVKLANFLTNLVPPKTSSQRRAYQQYGISTTDIPQFDISFQEFIIPQPKITINGETIPLDVSKLKDAILAEKNYLSSQLVRFAGNFVSKDLVQILNNDFIKKLEDLKTTLTLVDYDQTDINSDDDLYDSNDSRYRQLHRPQVRVDNTYVAPTYPAQIYHDRNMEEISFMDQLTSTLKDLVYNIQYDLTYLETKTKNDKDLFIDFSSSLKLNNKKWKISHELRNGKASLQKPDFNFLNSKDYDVAVAISEPMINGALNIATDQNLIQGVLNRVMPMPGVYIEKVNMHFEQGGVTSKRYKTLKPQLNDTAIDNTRVKMTNIKFNDGKSFEEYDEKKNMYRTIHHRTQDAIVAVAQIRVKLAQQPSGSFRSWLENQIGALLENGEIWFPIEIKFYPQIVQEEDKVFIELYAKDPFRYNGLVNTYDYPYKDMKNIVHNGLLKKLKKDLKPALEDLPRVELTPYLSYPGIKLRPLKVYVKKTGHLLITTDIDRLNLKELSEVESIK